MLIAGIVMIVVGALGGASTLDRPVAGLGAPRPVLAECPPRVQPPPSPVPPRTTVEPVVV